MNAVNTRVDSKFPEPEFSKLQQEVFASVQEQSAELAAIIRSEQSRAKAEQAPDLQQPPMIRFGAYEGDQLVGWSCGWFERGGSFYMANSGVRPSHRRKGIYKRLLEASVRHALDCHAVVVRSQHSVLNNPIIICKLKHGFQISGLSFSAQMGSLVELSLHLSTERGQLFRSRSIPLVPSSNDA